MRVTLDTNLLCYALDRSNPERRRSARELLLRVRSADCVLTMQTLGEFYSVAVRKFGLSAERAASIVDRLQRVFPVAVADSACLNEAMALHRHHRFQFWDALLLATAQKAGCALLLSEDGHDGMRLGGVTIVNPFNEKNRELLDAALPATD